MQAFLKNIYFILGLPVFEGSFCTLQGTFRRNAYALRFQSPHICTASLTDSFVLLRFCFRYISEQIRIQRSFAQEMPLNPNLKNQIQQATPSVTPTVRREAWFLRPPPTALTVVYFDDCNIF